MSEDIDITEEGTVLFVPERLNRDPVVVRGLTSDEVFGAGLLGGVLGLFVGITLWVVTGQLALIPTAMLLLGPFLILFFGGAILRRAKRGKPETWLYRKVQWQLATRFGLNVGQSLITRSGHWTIWRRDRFRDRLLKQQQQQDKA